MISTQALELRAGARLLVKGVTVRINNGDRIGFVGRNGAGKSTLAKVLAGENMPAGGAVNRTGKIGYLPQDPRVGEETGSVIERILSARNLDQISHRMRVVEEEMATSEGEALEKAMDRYTRVEHEFSAAGGYAATAEAEAIATSLGVSQEVFDHELATLSGGQRRRIELARILFSGAESLLLDEPINTKTKTIIINREHDKLCILETLFKNDTLLEKLISNFIGHIVDHDDINKFVSFNCLKDYLKDFNLLSKIVKLSCSIAHETPYKISFPNNDALDNITTYLNRQYIPFLPNDYFPTSF